MKQQVRTLVILAVFFLMALLMGCTSLLPQGPSVSRVPHVEIEEKHIGNGKIEELLNDAQKGFADAGEQVHFANERLRRCEKLLSSENVLSADERDVVESLQLVFERMSFEGQAMLARDVYEDELANGGSYQEVATSMEKLVHLLGAMVSRPELWEYEELRMLMLFKTAVETDRQNLAKNYDECLKAHVLALKNLRQVFENNHSAAYLTEANKLYKRQKGKWLNWKWVGCWRDDVNALYWAADYCNRIVEGQYVSAIPHNSAEELLNKVMRRMSKKERRFYAEKHRNAVTALNELPGYPANNTMQDAKSMAVKSFVEFKKGVPPEKTSDFVERKDITAR